MVTKCLSNKLKSAPLLIVTALIVSSGDAKGDSLL